MLRLSALSLLFFWPLLCVSPSGVMADPAPPSLEIIGLYSFRANRTEYDRFLARTIEEVHNPLNFSENLKNFLRDQGRGDEIRPLSREDREEWEGIYRAHLDEAVLVEVMVTNPDARFSVGHFIQPDPSRPPGQWQAAWNETFLTADGESRIELADTEKVPSSSRYRVVFVIHYWRQGTPLQSSYGDLTPPLPEPVPARLWRLAPYELPD
ncbi:hypothetical protein [Bradyrhizobium sp. STM 3809]|uniref:hypothetical protein n=1 Tax=Bradyrhizobium sp. STM 3809 TaxID=551936 RepID=UPI000240A2AF|nr:hypothetical protein [Bradyrhizobium sp. STM 3809]CCE02352.1 exported hypothetical protein [Bradyrhizobium sp. STM 3809]